MMSSFIVKGTAKVDRWCAMQDSNLRLVAAATAPITE